MYSLRDALLPPCRLIPPGASAASLAGDAASLVIVTAGKTLPLRTTGAASPALTDLVLPLLPMTGPFRKSADDDDR